MFSKYINTVLDRIALFYLYIKKLITILIFKRLKRKADKLARKHKVQIFVVKDLDKIKMITKEQFTYLRQHGKFKISVTATELKKIALYYTK